MSSDLVWLLTRNNNSFLVKRNGIQLSREPGNLLNLNSRKFSGLAAKKTVDVAAAPKGVTVTLRKTKAGNKPVATANATTYTKGTRASAKSVRNLLAHYRPDLEKAALARVARLNESAKPAKVQKPKKVRGVRARV
ncbi:60S ribosomal protein L28 [Rhizophlyctis rosea]|uniref:60S ribosomal protein L28 n=1 Tax=Rhizophlyctis rosea TaxID=64517 RepID=A0AAD5SN54_9FUNG|nr:60S ribosomal protein L28 [Rhizophlyctis rosea]